MSFNKWMNIMTVIYSIDYKLNRAIGNNTEHREFLNSSCTWYASGRQMLCYIYLNLWKEKTQNKF